jgi:hypothetical protein
LHLLVSSQVAPQRSKARFNPSPVTASRYTHLLRSSVSLCVCFWFRTRAKYRDAGNTALHPHYLVLKIHVIEAVVVSNLFVKAA